MSIRLSLPKRRNALILFTSVVIVLVLFFATVRVTYTGNCEGIFLLKGKKGSLFELQDDLFLGDGKRYIWGLSWDKEKHALKLLIERQKLVVPYIDYKWNETTGDGYVKSYLSNDRKMVTYFGRFRDDAGDVPLGLFVGGGEPLNVKDESSEHMNETGMAFYDGKRWLHLWCNTNEALITSRLETLYPSQWKFLGSRVLHYKQSGLIIESRHEVVADGEPLRINRRVFFRAGDAFFVLLIRVINAGTKPVVYSYTYGDEPWVGRYGTSGGNVGWAEDGLHLYEGLLDNGRKYAGYFDYGNEAFGEPHTFTMVSNFIEWFGEPSPVVYFSNSPTKLPETRAPLNGEERFIGLQWMQRTLNPGQAHEYTLAIGMADQDPKTGFPVKPEIDLRNYP